MAITRSMVKGGAKIPKEIIREIKQAAKYPITYTEDCPKSTPEALKEFAHLAAERDRRKKKQSVSVRVPSSPLE